MATFREIRDCLLFSHESNIINDEEFVLLYDEYHSKNLEIPYWNYGRFDLENITDDEGWNDFRFFPNDIYRL